MSNKFEINEYLNDRVSKSDTGFVIDILRDITKDVKDSQYFENEVIGVSARFEEVSRQNRIKTISNENFDLALNQINQALIEIIKKFNKENIFEKALETDFKFKIINFLDESQRLVILENEIVYLLSQLKKLAESYSTRHPAYEWISLFNQQVVEFDKKWKERRFQIAIIALVKAGKSTLLNAWIGNEYLPSATTPETMQIIRIRHNPNEKQGVLILNGEAKKRGVENIRNYLRELNGSSRKSSKEKKEKDVLLEMNLSVLRNKNLSGYGFDILDTPGTNEYGVATLESKVEYISKMSDVIIYLIDYTKLNTDSEAQMFENLKNWRKELFGQLKSRLFFVVNKIDVTNRHDRENNLSLGEVKKYVSNQIHSYTNFPIDENDIILVSAETALLSRLVGEKIASREQLKDFKIKAFGVFGGEEVSDEECMLAVPRLVKNSGFEELENKVLKLIYSTRSFIFFKSMVDEIEKSLNQVINNLEISKGTLKSNQETIDKLKIKIQTIRGSVIGFGKESAGFKKKAREVINKRLKEFDSAVEHIVSNAFERVAGSKKILTKNLLSVGDYEVIDSTKEDLLRKLEIINHYVIEAIDNQINLTWNTIKEDIYVQYIQLKENLESNSKPIISQVEKAISESFNIKLSPSNINIKSPSIVNYYNDMKYDMSSIVKSRLDFSGNILSFLVNAVKLLFLAIGNKDFPKYKISTVDYRNRISNTTKGVIAETTNIANELVESKYLSTVKNAESSLLQFIDRYILIIENEIKTQQANIVDIPERINNIEFDLGITKIVSKRIDSLNKSVTKYKN